MIWLLLILGLLICFISIFCLCFYITLIAKGECVTGKICEIDGGSSYGTGGSAHNIIVQFDRDGHTVKLHTLNHFFLAPFFIKYKLSRLRKKHIGRQVHIYYNPANEAQALVREYLWKDFLIGLALLFIGCFLILSIFMGWY